MTIETDAIEFAWFQNRGAINRAITAPNRRVASVYWHEAETYRLSASMIELGLIKDHIIGILTPLAVQTQDPQTKGQIASAIVWAKAIDRIGYRNEPPYYPPPPTEETHAC